MPIILQSSLTFHDNDLFYSNNYSFQQMSDSIKKDTIEFTNKCYLERIEKIDNDYFQSGKWKENYKCNGFQERTILSPLGYITYKRRYYMNKDKTKKDNFFFVDRFFGFSKNKLITNEALALILNMVEHTTYERAGKDSIPNATISKQSICNYLKSLNTVDNSYEPCFDITPIRKKIETPEILYIEADEAHCNLQKEKNTNTKEYNTTDHTSKYHKSKNIIDKLVIVHEGHKYEYSLEKRKELKNKAYFGGIKRDHTELSYQVVDYIRDNYDTNKIKTIFISGDGASWIDNMADEVKTLLRNTNIRFVKVLDKFHTRKYLNSIFNGNKKKVDFFYFSLPDLKQNDFRNLANSFYNSQINHNISLESFSSKVEYICNNLEKIKNQLEPLYLCPCSMEGQISHVLSSRLTSRPKGFCLKNLTNLSQIIIVKKNGFEITADLIAHWLEPIKEPKETFHYKHVSLRRQKRTYCCSVHLPLSESFNTNQRIFAHNLAYGTKDNTVI